jgi:hypothetical protein
MAMTLTNFIEEVRENIKRDTNGVSDVRITRWINWSKDYLAQLHTYKEMMKVFSSVTVDGTYRYDTPARMKDIYSITLVDGSSSGKLTYYSAREVDELVPSPVDFTEGRPSIYVDYGTSFEFYKIPDAVYNLVVRCSQFPLDLVGGRDTCSFLNKDALLVAMTTTFGFWNLREIEDAAYWGGELVPTLYNASLAGEPKGEDWGLRARGFGNVGSVGISGDWWKSPFVGRRV